jgi:hypothetical protein
MVEDSDADAELVARNLVKGGADAASDHRSMATAGRLI